MIKRIFLPILMSIPCSVYALGMQPETTVLIFNEEKNEASISVKNTNSVPSLLQTKIVDIGEAENVLVLSSPSIVKIEPGESQIVRFFLKKNSDFDTQILKRVRFLGVPAKQESNKENSSLTFTVGQSIPLLINPVGLKVDREPWKHLTYSFDGRNIIISNPSKYIVRMYPEVKVNGKKIKVEQSYITPRTKLTIKYERPPSEITIVPVGLYGELR
ncbi:fimbria/pilus periplasmic chaperone, partial [Escherichia coli]